MYGAVLHAAGDVRYDELPEPSIVKPTDAIIRTVATCVCGSDLWSYRGTDPIAGPAPFGHEYVGVVEEVGADVAGIKPGQFVVGSFFASDNTCAHCKAGYQASCVQREFFGACQSEYIRIPLADGTLVATPGEPDAGMVPSLLAASDVMGTGWYAAAAAQVTTGTTAVVIGDGAVGLCAVIAAKALGAERIIAVSSHSSRQKLALEFGATDIVPERGPDGVERVMELTGGIGADSVLECVGTGESVQQALRSTRPGGNVGFVGMPHGVDINGFELFFSAVGLRGGPAPVRGYLPALIKRIFDGTLDPGRVFDMTLPLAQVADAYRAMDERRAVKVLLTP